MGFVYGKTQPKYPWDSWLKTYTAEPEEWFHEVLHTNDTLYKNEETDLIKKLTSQVNSK